MALRNKNNGAALSEQRPSISACPAALPAVGSPLVVEEIVNGLCQGA